VAKTINLTYGVDSAVFTYKPIDRSIIYGKRKRIALDAEGKECAKASLLADGSLLIRSGMTAQGYFTPDNKWVSQSDLEALNLDGTTPKLHPSTIGENVSAEKISAAEALSMRFTTTYSLNVEQLPDGLKKELDAGAIFKFPFNPRADYQMETGILISNENGYFAVIGQPVQYELSSLTSVVSVSEEAADDSGGDLDFEMF